MAYNIPTISEVASFLSGLDTSGLKELAATSGVPFTTLWKIKSGETTDPRLNTVRELAPHLVKKRPPVAIRKDGTVVEKEERGTASESGRAERRQENDLAARVPPELDRRADLKAAKLRARGE